jgi:hypothetical protein
MSAAAILWPIMLGACALTVIGIWGVQRCRHQWTTIEHGHLYGDGFRGINALPTGKWHILRCSKCGWIRRRDLS